MNFRDLPKVELHLHLEGAAPPEFIRELAAEQGVRLDGVFDEAGAYRWRDFAEFLETYHKACEVLRGPDEFRRLTEAVLAKSAADGVVYTEIFIAPDIGGADPVAWAEHLAALVEGAKAARAATGIEARFISTCIRNLGPEQAERAAQLTVDAPNPWLVGWGMGGEERMHSAADFKPAFAIAAEAGLGITSHAGEMRGADSVSETIAHLPVDRIGHGVRAIEDPEVVAQLAHRGITLECNPGSNIALGVFADWPDHPIERLRKAGVRVTVSTDDPPYFHTDMVHEYKMLSRTFSWKDGDFRALNAMAMEAAFCDDQTKAKIMRRLEDAAPHA